ncbi:hypothetical protein ACFSLT_30235 [Novosphingobium resinovorum]
MITGRPKWPARSRNSPDPRHRALLHPHAGRPPPIYSRFNPGWFVGEAVVERVYTQFIEHNGRFYAGYANLGPGGRRWQLDDIEALEATGTATEVDWFPSET